MYHELTALPGVGRPSIWVRSMVNSTGTNASRTRTSLLPDPLRPGAYQVSTTSQSGRCTRHHRFSGGPSSRSTGVPRMTHWQASLPLENCQSPDTTTPPSTRRPRPVLNENAEPTRVSGSSPHTASCTAGGYMPNSQAWEASTACTQALEPQARPSVLLSATWVRP